MRAAWSDERRWEVRWQRQCASRDRWAAAARWLGGRLGLGFAREGVREKMMNSVLGGRSDVFTRKGEKKKELDQFRVREQ